jgi:hypothetical protein
VGRVGEPKKDQEGCVTVKVPNGRALVLEKADTKAYTEKFSGNKSF